MNYKKHFFILVISLLIFILTFLYQFFYGNEAHKKSEQFYLDCRTENLEKLENILKEDLKSPEKTTQNFIERSEAIHHSKHILKLDSYKMHNTTDESLVSASVAFLVSLIGLHIFCFIFTFTSKRKTTLLEDNSTTSSH